MTLEETLKTLAEHAPRLRTAGVRTLKVGDLSVTLAPPDPPIVEDDGDDKDANDPLDDPATFGRLSGVPGYQREEV